jgi:hypothetical protein
MSEHIIRIPATYGRQRPDGKRDKEDSTPGLGPRTSKEENQRYLRNVQYELHKLRHQESVRTRQRENSMPPIVSVEEHNRLKSIVAMLERLQRGDSADTDRLKEAVRYIDDRVFRGYGAQNHGKPEYISLLEEECYDFEAVKAILKVEITRRESTTVSASGTTECGTDPKAKKTRKQKGRIPATPAERAADKEIARQWKEYRKQQAEGPDGNRKPTLAAFASTIGKTYKQVREALDRHATRQKRRGAVNAK